VNGLRVTPVRVLYYCLLILAILWVWVNTVIGLGMVVMYPALVLVIVWIIMNIPFFVCIIIGVWLHRRKPSEDRPAPSLRRAPPPEPVTHQPREQTQVIREREVREVVLIVCPYCGTKNQQGVLRCSNCDARL
jgi:hypothetical protein